MLNLTVEAACRPIMKERCWGVARRASLAVIKTASLARVVDFHTCVIKNEDNGENKAAKELRADEPGPACPHGAGGEQTSERQAEDPMRCAQSGFFFLTFTPCCQNALRAPIKAREG